MSLWTSPAPGPQQIVWMFVPIDYERYKNNSAKKTLPGYCFCWWKKHPQGYSDYSGMKSGFQLYAEHMFRIGASSHIGHCYSQAHQVPYVFFQTSPKSSHTNHNPSLPKYPLDHFLGGRLFFWGLPIQLLSESLQKAAKLFFSGWNHHDRCLPMKDNPKKPYNSICRTRVVTWKWVKKKPGTLGDSDGFRFQPVDFGGCICDRYAVPKAHQSKTWFQTLRWFDDFGRTEIHRFSTCGNLNKQTA